MHVRYGQIEWVCIQQSHSGGGAMLTIVLYAGIDILEYIFNDHATLAMLSGTLAMDLMKVEISTIVGLIMRLGVGVISAYAALPIGVAMVVGTGTNILLDRILYTALFGICLCKRIYKCAPYPIDESFFAEC